MSVLVSDSDFTLYCGDALTVLRGLPAESVHCCVTSPPFYALRDYGVEGQIGLEATPEEWCARLVEVFAEVRRVLRRDGTLWVECGDSYVGSTQSGGSQETRLGGGLHRLREQQASQGHIRLNAQGTKPKDLLGQPWLLAFALRADGWYLRQAIIWHKPNAMPESVTDRCTTAHSYVFLLAKSPRYYFDADAIAEPAEWARWGDQTVPKYEGTETASGWMQPKTKNELMARGGRTTNGQREHTEDIRGFDNRLDRVDGRKNARSVWTIPTRGYPEAHFATFPEALVERCILAGTSERGVCPECGAPWVREVARAPMVVREGPGRAGLKAAAGDASSSRTAITGTMLSPAKSETIGWAPTCECRVSGHNIAAFSGLTFDPIPATVLDPFIGSGTTALVARRHGRRTIGIELSPSYCELAARRLQQLSLLADV